MEIFSLNLSVVSAMHYAIDILSLNGGKHKRSIQTQFNPINMSGSYRVDWIMAAAADKTGFLPECTRVMVARHAPRSQAHCKQLHMHNLNNISPQSKAVAFRNNGLPNYSLQTVSKEAIRHTSFDVLTILF